MKVFSQVVKHVTRLGIAALEEREALIENSDSPMTREQELKLAELNGRINTLGELRKWLGD